MKPYLHEFHPPHPTSPHWNQFDYPKEFQAITSVLPPQIFAAPKMTYITWCVLVTNHNKRKNHLELGKTAGRKNML